MYVQGSPFQFVAPPNPSLLTTTALARASEIGSKLGDLPLARASLLLYYCICTVPGSLLAWRTRTRPIGGFARPNVKTPRATMASVPTDVGIYYNNVSYFHFFTPQAQAQTPAQT
jgi:hypothetical protein